jgi:hypothetical protein
MYLYLARLTVSVSRPRRLMQDLPRYETTDKCKAADATERRRRGSAPMSC